MPDLPPAPTAAARTHPHPPELAPRVLPLIAVSSAALSLLGGWLLLPRR